MSRDLRGAALLLALLAALSVVSGAAAKPSTAHPRPTPSPPAITVVNVRFDNARPNYSRGYPYPRITGTVWIANDTQMTLTDVVVSVLFYNDHWDSYDGSVDEKVGTLDPMAKRAVNFRWEQTEGEYVVPRIRVRWRQPGDPTVHVLKYDDFLY